LSSCDDLPKEDDDTPLEVHPKKTLVSTRSRTADKVDENEKKIELLESNAKMEVESQRFHENSALLKCF
jgi:hypothetical protein